MDAQQIQGILGLGLPSGGTSGSAWFDTFTLPLSTTTYCQIADASFLPKL